MLTLIALVIALLFLSWPWNVLIVVAAAVVDIAETGVFVWWSRRRRYPAAVGAGTLVGLTGVALARLVPGAPPGGQVRVEGEIWSARSDVAIDPGTRVVVKAVDGLVLTVAPAPPG